jgi:hypothetical protein
MNRTTQMHRMSCLVLLAGLNSLTATAAPPEAATDPALLQLRLAETEMREARKAPHAAGPRDVASDHAVKGNSRPIKSEKPGQY